MKRKILIVDDEESILSAMREFFSLHGFEVDCAREPRDAEALLEQGCYAVVIADLCLAGSRGEEGLQVLETAQERCPSTRTILLTAYGSNAVQAEARRRGVDVLLHKPHPLPEVARIIRDLLTDAAVR